MPNQESLIEKIKRHEGFKLKPYRCTAGKLTIAYGRNLDDVGLSLDEANYLLRNDVNRVIGQLYGVLPWVSTVSGKRFDVLVNMGFNIGVPRLLTFKKFLAAIVAGDFELAASEMLNSKWANQVGSRAIELANDMRHG